MTASESFDSVATYVVRRSVKHYGSQFLRNTSADDEWSDGEWSSSCSISSILGSDDEMRVSNDFSKKPRASTDVPEKPRVSNDVSEKPKVSNDVSEKPKASNDVSEKPRVCNDDSEKPRVGYDVSKRATRTEEICWFGAKLLIETPIHDSKPDPGHFSGQIEASEQFRVLPINTTVFPPKAKGISQKARISSSQEEIDRLIQEELETMEKEQKAMQDKKMASACNEKPKPEKAAAQAQKLNYEKKTDSTTTNRLEPAYEPSKKQKVTRINVKPVDAPREIPGPKNQQVTRVNVNPVDAPRETPRPKNQQVTRVNVKPLDAPREIPRPKNQQVTRVNVKPVDDLRDIPSTKQPPMRPPLPNVNRINLKPIDASTSIESPKKKKKKQPKTNNEATITKHTPNIEKRKVTEAATIEAPSYDNMVQATMDPQRSGTPNTNKSVRYRPMAEEIQKLQFLINILAEADDTPEKPTASYNSLSESSSVHGSKNVASITKNTPKNEKRKVTEAAIMESPSYDNMVQATMDPPRSETPNTNKSVRYRPMAEQIQKLQFLINILADADDTTEKPVGAASRNSLSESSSGHGSLPSSSTLLALPTSSSSRLGISSAAAQRERIRNAIETIDMGTQSKVILRTMNPLLTNDMQRRHIFADTPILVTVSTEETKKPNIFSRIQKQAARFGRYLQRKITALSCIS